MPKEENISYYVLHIRYMAELFQTFDKSLIKLFTNKYCPGNNSTNINELLSCLGVIFAYDKETGTVYFKDENYTDVSLAITADIPVTLKMHGSKILIMKEMCAEVISPLLNFFERRDVNVYNDLSLYRYTIKGKEVLVAHSHV